VLPVPEYETVLTPLDKYLTIQMAQLWWLAFLVLMLRSAKQLGR